MEKHITANEQVRKTLKERFDCNISTVTKSLNFERFGPKARAIRSYAINFLGCSIENDNTRYL